MVILAASTTVFELPERGKLSSSTVVMAWRAVEKVRLLEVIDNTFKAGTHQ